jgi:hypothetical protein
MSSAHVSTTYDYLTALSRYGDCDVTYLHVTHGADVVVDLSDYDVVFNNYCARLCFEGYVCESYLKKLKNFNGLKVISVQDVYDRTYVLRQAIRDYGFHVVLVSAPDDSFDYLFDLQAFPNVTFRSTLTGFCPEQDMTAGVEIKPLKDRAITLAYRGRDIGPRYGTLGFLKYEIGRVGAAACIKAGIPHDIAMDEDSRIYGQDWYAFIASTRAMLGTDSGSNVVDFDGSIETHFKRLKEELGRNLPYETHLPFVAERETHITMSEASPRMFECAAMRTAMVSLRGHYSGVMQAEIHYIPLERDFSNLDSVLDRLNDLDALEAMTQRAYEDLIASGRFSHRQFAQDLVQMFQDERAARLYLRPQIKRVSKTSKAKLKPRQAAPTKLPHHGPDFFMWLESEPAPVHLTGFIKRTFSRVPIVARLTNRLPD